MTKKIFATLKNGTTTKLFEEDYNKFTELEKIFELDINSLEKVNFLQNLNSSLESNEIYFISFENNSEAQEFIQDIVLDINSIDLNEIQQEEYKEVKVLQLINSENNFVYFKRIFPMQYVKNRKILGFDNGPKFEEENNRITLFPSSDVIYDKINNTLYFRKFSNLRDIFPKIIEKYRFASHSEIISFFNMEKFEIKEDTISNLNNKNRSRIAQLIDSNIDFENDELMKKYEKYSKKYGKKIEKEDNKYILNSKNKLLSFIDVLEEKYYETSISKQKRQADKFRNL